MAQKKKLAPVTRRHFVPGVSTASRREVRDLFGWEESAPSSTCALQDWSFARGDAPLLAYIYRHLAPRRHLEFGTWEGVGTCLCLDNSAATVWTINLPEGETKPDGSWAYGHRVTQVDHGPPGAVAVRFGRDEEGPQIYHQTDAATYIGHLYRERKLGHRVCQIYCDSRDWDTSVYPSDFFDSVLIDGGHAPEIVASDTRKALSLLRPGGLALWHDFCPLASVRKIYESVADVTSGIASLVPEIRAQCRELFWINPSWLLVGVKK